MYGDTYPLVFVRVIYESLDAAAFDDVHGDILVKLRDCVSRTQFKAWKGHVGKTHCQKLDDPFDPSGEDHASVFSVARVVTADIVMGWAASMSAECNVLNRGVSGGQGK